MAQAQLEGEVRRLRDELQRKETALHRAEAARGGQARELQRALEELETLRGRLQEVEEEEEEGSGDRESGSGSEGGEAGGMEEVQVVQEGPMTEQVSACNRQLVCLCVHTTIQCTCTCTCCMYVNTCHQVQWRAPISYTLHT